MKHKNLIRSLYIIPVLAASLLSSCTDKFEEFNEDPYGITKESLTQDFNNVGLPFKQIQLSLYVNDPAWNTQLQQNLIADLYSGYMASPTPFVGNVNNQTYALVDGWNGFPWSDGYDMVMKPVANLVATTKEDYPDFYSWALILKVAGMHRVTDIYGPIIYSKFGVPNPDGSVSYDSQEDVYNAFFTELDEAITLLTPYANNEANLSALPFRRFDIVYNGSYTKWVKFANSLRLRLAIRIAKVNPAKAKLEGEKSLNHPLGLLTSNTDNFNIQTPTTHPLNVINNSWGDIRLGAPIESILGGYEDPRLEKYAVPVSADTLGLQGKIKGIRGGVDIDAKSRYVIYSSLVTFPNMIQLMTASEVALLKAEASIRGWSGAGDSKTNYEQGIKLSFDQYGAGGFDAYVTDDTKTAMPYLDPVSKISHQNDVLAGSPYLNSVTVKWDNGAPFETKLQKIITQKWIAMYPDGQEAWSEFRRTGYPKLFPVVVNNSGGEISSEAFIKRIKFASGEKSTNPSGVAGAVTLLSGADTGGTSLWWDID
jgi:hypothetical protein